MKDIIFKGAGVALVTPMNADGSINYEKLHELVNFHIENGTDAIVACGTTGEAPTLTDSEHVEVIKQCVEAAKGRIPIIAGTGSNDTAYAVWLSKEAEKVGADALLQSTPYYNRTSQEGLIKHFEAVAKAVDIPIMLYNVPSRTGMDIKPETYHELTKIPNIVATKEANGNISALQKTIKLCGDDLAIYSGNDDQTTVITALGGLGVISVLSNVAPMDTHLMVEHALNGKFKESLALQVKYLDLIDALFSVVNPIPVKDAMNMMGFDVGPLRLPLYSMNEAQSKVVIDALKGVNLL
jgi:4-hydroxy-tetrahydrodipicolinate synthase